MVKKIEEFNRTVITLFALILLIFGFVTFFYLQKGSYEKMSETQAPITPKAYEAPKVESASDLDKLNAELDNSNIDEIDTLLGEFDKESSF